MFLGKNKGGRSRRKGQTLEKVRWNAQIEPLEKRELFVVGATALAPAVVAGTGYDGVVQVGAPNGGCTGSLLSTGRHVLTAAHCVDFNVDLDGDGRGDTGDGVIDAGSYQIRFNLPGRNETISNIPSSNVSVAPGWTGSFQNDDIAIIELTRLAPVDAERYSIYRGTSEVGRTVTLVGYGNSGRGIAVTGQPAGHTNDGTKRIGNNRIDSAQNSRLRLDLDNPAGSGDVWRESITANGDSGGPAFIGYAIAGVTSGGTLQPRFTTAGVPSYGWTGNAFGEWADFTRVSDYASWIDSVTDDPYTLTLDLRDQPVGNNGASDYTSLSFNYNTWHMEIRVNGQLYFDDHYSRIRSVIVEGSNDNDYFAIDSVNLLDDIQVDGNSGSDSLRGYSSGYKNRWTINGMNRGELTNGVQDVDFQSIETLLGGSRDDEFKFVGSFARITTAVHAGAGNDTLDFSEYFDDVYVNLETNRATAIGSQLANRATSFEHIRGSRYSDTLIGNQAHNTIWGGDGNDQIWGRSGNDTIYGGDGDDTLYGEEGVDYLFGQGDTDYLDGGVYAETDHLWGGSGQDTFVVQNSIAWRPSGFYWTTNDQLHDRTSEDRVIMRYS